MGGKISFEKFKEDTEKFTQQQDILERQNTINSNKKRIAGLTLGLIAERDVTSKTYKAIKKERDDLIVQTSKDEIALAETQVGNQQKNQQTKLDQINAYAQAIGNVATSVIGFWQAANEAEAAALDRSIALQQRRVDEALRIADKGNAQYLKAEKDRLKELEVEREASARRQLGVNAALQASQILVAITGAIAKLATSPLGTAQVFAEIAVIVGALATGYGLVKQLQANQPTFAEGTLSVERGRNKPGVDTVPAWLSEGEAVIPVSKNRKYKKAVEAIYHGAVPADEMNEFVQNYATSKKGKNELHELHEVQNMQNVQKDTYQNFVSNVSQVSSKDLKEFIEKHQSKTFLKGTPAVPASVPGWLTEGEAVIPAERNTKYNTAVNAIYNERIPADVLNKFVSRYSTESKSDKIDRVLSKEFLKENYTEKDIESYSGVVDNVLTKDHVTLAFVENLNKRDFTEKTKLVYSLQQLTKRFVGQDHDRSFVNNITAKDVKDYTQVIHTMIDQHLKENNVNDLKGEVNSIVIKSANEIISQSATKDLAQLVHTAVNSISSKKVSEQKVASLVSKVASGTIDTSSETNRLVYAMTSLVNKEIGFDHKTDNIKTYERFVAGLSKAPEKVVTEFINEYERATVEKQIREKATQKEVMKEKVVSSKLHIADHNGFINTFHSVRHVPQPNYEHIASVNEMKLGQDGKLRATLEEQNSLLKENNEHQKETQRILKAMDFQIKIDEEGVSAMVMKAIEQKKIYSKL